MDNAFPDEMDLMVDVRYLGPLISFNVPEISTCSHLPALPMCRTMATAKLHGFVLKFQNQSFRLALDIDPSVGLISQGFV